MKIRKTFRSAAAFLVAAAMAMGMMTVPAAAASAPEIEDVSYDGKGKVEVDFVGHVEYKNCKVTVKDTKGKSYKATIIEKDNDDLDFKIKKYKTNRTYKFTIKKIRKAGSSSWTSVKGKVKIPKSSKVVVEDVEYDRSDREVSFDFKGRVEWKSAKVTIKDGNGKNYVKYIKEKENDGIEVKVKKLTYGKKYTYKISGVRNAGKSKWKTVYGSFKAVDND